MTKRLLTAILCAALLLSLFVPAVMAENLKYGAKGEQVKLLQTRLSQLGFYSKDIDSKFGFSTYQAVLGFQNLNGLKVDGVAGPVTIAKMYSSDVVSISGTKVTTPFAVRVAYGHEGPAVFQVQQRLVSLGYYGGGVDSKFGYATFLAVKAFQKVNGLKVDGIIGPQSWAKLFDASALAKSAATVPVPPLPPEAPFRLKYGYTGDVIAQLQNHLYSLNYYKGVADGKFGFATYSAVRAFQARNGLKVDGVVGPVTWAKLTGGTAVAAP